MKKISSQEVAEQCLACGCDDQWLVVGTNTWKCRHCHPPPSEAFVADVKGHRIESNDWVYLRDREPVIVCYEFSACPECLSKWIVDTFGQDGRSRCYACRRTISTAEIESAMGRKVAVGPP